MNKTIKEITKEIKKRGLNSPEEVKAYLDDNLRLAWNKSIQTAMKK